MIRTQVYLTEQEQNILIDLIHQTHKTQSELIREAINFFGEHQLHKNRETILHNVKGLWKYRNDLPDSILNFKRGL